MLEPGDWVEVDALPCHIVHWLTEGKGPVFKALGIPSEVAHIAAYCHRTRRAGIPARDWEYYMAFNMFRLAAIMQGIMARALSGTAASSEALEMGRRARPLAELAWRQVERLQN